MLLLFLLSAYALKSHIFNSIAIDPLLILDNGWFAWTIMPYLAANIGFWVTAIGSYVLTHYFCKTSDFVNYGTKDRMLRWKEANVSFLTQLPSAFKVVGILMGFNTAFGKYFFRRFGATAEEAFPEFEVLLMDSAKMFVLFDLFLYWQHRASHTFTIMWNSHKVHHELRTPIAASASRIGFWDQVEVAAVIYLVAYVVQPHPVTYSFSIACILSELAADHSGLDSSLFDFLTLRFLPGRASVSMHDQHHMYSDYKGGKNFGHFFWIWDYMFGTLSTSKTMKQKRAKECLGEINTRLI